MGSIFSQVCRQSETLGEAATLLISPQPPAELGCDRQRPCLAGRPGFLPSQLKPPARSVPGIQKALSNCLLEAGAIAQSVKCLQMCLPCKHEDVSSIPRTHISCWGGTCLLSQHWGLTGQQPSPFSETQATESPCLQTTRWNSASERVAKVVP